MRLVVQAVEALHHGLLDLLHGIDRLASVGVDLQDALVMKLHLQVLRPAAIATQPARLRAHGLLRGSLHLSIMAASVLLASSGCSLGADDEAKPASGPPAQIAATVDRLERAVAARDYDTDLRSALHRTGTQACRRR